MQGLNFELPELDIQMDEVTFTPPILEIELPAVTFEDREIARRIYSAFNIKTKEGGANGTTNNPGNIPGIPEKR